MPRNQLIIHSVNPTGMFSYGLSDDISIYNKGKVYIKGINADRGDDSNGAGKSSLFNAICELLFRENPTGCKNDEVINAVWNKGMAGRVVFTNYLGEHYRVTYCRKWKDPIYEADNDNKVAYLGTSLFLDKYDDGIWVDCRGKGMPETAQKIQEAVGMTYSRFIAISYMNNRAGDQFLRGTNKDRMDLLSGIIGIGEWDYILENCRIKKKSLNSQINGVESKIHYEKGSLEVLQEQYEGAVSFDYAGHIKTQEKLLEEAKAGWRLKAEAIKEQENNIVMLKDQQENSYNQTKVAELNAEASALQQELRLKERDLSRPVQLGDDPKLSQQLRIVNSQISEINGSLRAFLGANSTLLEREDCPTCGSVIPESKKEVLQENVNDLKEQLVSLEEERLNLQKAINDDKRQRDQEARANRVLIASDIEELRQRISNLATQAQEEKSKSFKYDSEISVIRQKIAEIKVEQQHYEATGHQIKAEIKQAKTSLENLKALDKQIESKKEHLKFFKKEIDDISGELDVYLWLIENIPYIKLHKMSVAMAEISDLCNQYFEEIGDSIRLHISSFEEKAKKRNAADVKDLMKSDVKLEIIDGGKNINPKLYSDGEAGKVSVAILRALNEMARKSGQGCNLMVMDESFSFVDTNNSQKIANSLSSILDRGTVFLTDNSGYVEDLINFDEVWVARKENGQTTLELP